MERVYAIMKLHRRSNSTIAIFAVAMLVAVVGTRVFAAQSSGQEPQLVMVMSGGWPTEPRLPELVLYRDGTAVYLDNDLGVLMRSHLEPAEQRALIEDAKRVLIPDRNCPGAIFVDVPAPTVFYWDSDIGQARVSGVRGNRYENGPECREFWEFAKRLSSFGEGLGTAWSSQPIELTLWTNPAARATNREPIQWPAEWPGLSQALPVEGRKNELHLVLPNSPEMLSALKSLVTEANRARRRILIDGREVAILLISIAPNESLPGQDIWEGAIDSIGKAN
jgi:hypothetical protein